MSNALTLATCLCTFMRAFHSYLNAQCLRACLCLMTYLHLYTDEYIRYRVSRASYAQDIDHKDAIHEKACVQPCMHSERVYYYTHI